MGGHEGRFSRDPLPVFSAGGPCEQLWHGQGCPLFVVVHAAFPLLTTASPTLQGALKDAFGEAVEACDMPEPCKFPSTDSCQKRFLWTHKEVDFALHPVSLVHQVGDVEKFPEAHREVNGQKLESVTSFKYLGSVITDEGSKPELLCRIAQQQQH